LLRPFKTLSKDVSNRQLEDLHFRLERLKLTSNCRSVDTQVDISIPVAAACSSHASAGY
jgi:hypothetical protein